MSNQAEWTATPSNDVREWLETGALQSLPVMQRKQCHKNTTQYCARFVFMNCHAQTIVCTKDCRSYGGANIHRLTAVGIIEQAIELRVSRLPERQGRGYATD